MSFAPDFWIQCGSCLQLVSYGQRCSCGKTHLPSKSIYPELDERDDASTGSKP